MCYKNQEKDKNSFGKIIIFFQKILDIVNLLCYYIIRKEVEGMRPNKKRTKSLTITLNLFVLKIDFKVEWA